MANYNDFDLDVKVTNTGAASARMHTYENCSTTDDTRVTCSTCAASCSWTRCQSFCSSHTASNCR